MRKILLISTLLFVTCSAKLTKECLVDYLKFRNVENEVFSSIDPYTGDPGTCTDAVKSKVREIYDSTRSKMDANFKQKPYADCAMTEIETEQYQNILLTAEVIEMKGVGLKFWKINSKKSKVEELQNQAQELSDAALIKCKGQTDYGAFFDSFYEQKRTEPMTDQFDYCLRRHLIDNLVISTLHYNFKVNPKKINIDYINCDEIMRVAVEQLRSSISSAGSVCVINTFIDNGYLDLILKIHLLTKLNLSLIEKENEKRVFVDSMISMTHKIKSCPM